MPPLSAPGTSSCTPLQSGRRQVPPGTASCYPPAGPKTHKAPPRASTRCSVPSDDISAPGRPW